MSFIWMTKVGKSFGICCQESEKKLSLCDFSYIILSLLKNHTEWQK